MEGANFRIKGRNVFRINLRILIFTFTFLLASTRVNNVVVFGGVNDERYHVYKEIWDAVVGQEFPSKCEYGNRVDPFAVAVVRGDTVIGHVPRKILSIYSLYRRDGSSTVCTNISRRC